MKENESALRGKKKEKKFFVFMCTKSVKWYAQVDGKPFSLIEKLHPQRLPEPDLCSLGLHMTEKDEKKGKVSKGKEKRAEKGIATMKRE